MSKQQEPGSSESKNNELKSEQIKKRIQELQGMLEKDQGNQDTLIRLANNYRDLGEWEQARLHAQKALKGKDLNLQAEAKITIAMVNMTEDKGIYRNKQKIQETIKLFKEAIDVLPYELPVIKNMARLHSALGDPGNLKKSFELHKQAININPKDASSMYDLAACYFHGRGVNKNFNKAMQYCDAFSRLESIPERHKKYVTKFDILRNDIELGMEKYLAALIGDAVPKEPEHKEKKDKEALKQEQKTTEAKADQKFYKAEKDLLDKMTKGDKETRRKFTKNYIKTGNILLDQPIDSKGNTVLHYVSMAGDGKLMEELLSAVEGAGKGKGTGDVDLHKPNKEGKTPHQIQELSWGARHSARGKLTPQDVIQSYMPHVKSENKGDGKGK